jgi:hypothetical protein
MCTPGEYSDAHTRGAQRSTIWQPRWREVAYRRAGLSHRLAFCDASGEGVPRLASCLARRCSSLLLSSNHDCTHSKLGSLRRASWRWRIAGARRTAADRSIGSECVLVCLRRLACCAAENCAVLSGLPVVLFVESAGLTQRASDGEEGVATSVRDGSGWDGELAPKR